MRYIKLYEDFQMGDLNFMSPEEIQWLFFEECWKETPDINLIRVILDNGLVDVNAKDRYDYSPLHWAVGRDNIALAKYLISAGADVNAKTKNGKPLLHSAIDSKNIVLVEYLISAGADVNIKDNGGVSPLVWAVFRNNKQIEDLLKKHGAVE